ncbi:DUF4232 domain-containing protein [Streptomyces sp. NPDC093097]|uniref:DUF4232 domain-containing protein n=1 Tax=Streptomyces sp. NPDC093097 TaxID=3366027 RepID=UPI00382636F5
MRTPALRRPRTRLFAAATLALAALSLTACGTNDSSGVRSEGAAPAASEPSAAASSPGAAEKPAGGSAGASGSSGTANSGHSTGHGGNGAATTKKHPAGDPGDPANRVPCSAANTKITAAPVERPLNYMLLTVTNTGSKLCDLNNYPIVKFEGAQSVPPVMEDSKPQAVTSLKPGERGYAGIILSAGDGSGGEGYTARSLEIGFDGSDRMARAALPAGGVHIDNSLRVTYWLSDASDALS